LFGIAALKWELVNFQDLNIGEIPIAHKYCEGKVKRTLKRELKEHSIVMRGT
jgi:hypothetical protein